MPAPIKRPSALLKSDARPTVEHVIARGAEDIPLPEPGDDNDRKTVNVYLPRRALPIIDAAARKWGLTRSAYIRMAILEKLEHDGGGNW